MAPLICPGCFGASPITSSRIKTAPMEILDLTISQEITGEGP